MVVRPRNRNGHIPVAFWRSGWNGIGVQRYGDGGVRKKSRRDPCRRFTENLSGTRRNGTAGRPSRSWKRSARERWIGCRNSGPFTRSVLGQLSGIECETKIGRYPGNDQEKQEHQSKLDSSLP